MKLYVRHQYGEERARFLEERIGDTWEFRGPGDVADESEGMIDADAIVSMSWSAAMSPAPNVKLIQLPGAGLDQIDFDAVPDGATVCNVYEHEIGIAEFLVLAMLEWEIRLAAMDAALREGRWIGSFVLDGDLHGELFGKTVGFVGYGRIAAETAKRLKSFGVSTIACTRTPSRRDEHIDEIGGMDAFKSMLGAAHYVVVSCPLTDETRGLFDHDAFDAMRDDAVVLNVGRGPIIDETALYEACRTRSIGGAVIDTWYKYATTKNPTCLPSDHPFQDLDNVIMTPHASGWSAGLLTRRWTVITDNLRRLERGEPLSNVASP